MKVFTLPGSPQAVALGKMKLIITELQHIIWERWRTTIIRVYDA